MSQSPSRSWRRNPARPAWDASRSAFDLQRFVSVRDGPNVRQSYDAAWAEAMSAEPWRILGFYSLPVQNRDVAAFDDYSSDHLTYGGAPGRTKAVQGRSSLGVLLSHYTQDNVRDFRSVSANSVTAPRHPRRPFRGRRQGFRLGRRGHGTDRPHRWGRYRGLGLRFVGRLHLQGRRLDPAPGPAARRRVRRQQPPGPSPGDFQPIVSERLLRDPGRLYRLCELHPSQALGDLAPHQDADFNFCSRRRRNGARPPPTPSTPSPPSGSPAPPGGPAATPEPTASSAPIGR